MAKIGSRGRTRRLCPIYFEEKCSISAFRIKLIRQNQHLLCHYTFTTFTTRFTTHFYMQVYARGEGRNRAVHVRFQG